VSELTRWAISVVAVGVLLIVLHWLASKFAPRSEGDARLGTVGFWVWVGITALFVHFVFAPLDPPLYLPVPDKVRLGMFLVGIFIWVAEKSGLLEWPDWISESQEDHEEAWATMLGLFIGFFAPDVLSSLGR
jgi:hypothetical protein